MLVYPDRICLVGLPDPLDHLLKTWEIGILALGRYVPDMGSELSFSCMIHVQEAKTYFFLLANDLEVAWFVATPRIVQDLLYLAI